MIDGESLWSRAGLFRLTKKGDAGISIKVSIPLEQGSLFLILPSLWFGAMTWAGFYLRNIASSFTNGNRESYKGGDIVKSAVNFLKKLANGITKSLCIHYDSPVLSSRKLNTFSPILNNQLRYHIKCFIARY